MTSASHHSFERQAADLKHMLDVTRHLGASVELDPLLARIIEAATTVLDAERATVFLLDRAKGELYSRIATGIGGDGIKEIRFSVSRGIAGEVARTGEILEIPDAYADRRFNPDIDKHSGYLTRNILTCPLWGHDQSIVGVLQVLNKRVGSFDQWDRDKIQILGAQAGVAVQRQSLLDEFAEKQRIQADLNIARVIQQRGLPKENPAVEGFEVAGWNKPANETGGDCYDFMSLADGRLAITLADATGHGIGPALVIAECRALFRAVISGGFDLHHAVTQVNALLCQDLPDDRFVTAFFGVLVPQEQQIIFTSAGQGPLLRYDAASRSVAEVASSGLPLGILPDTEYDPPVDLPLSSGDMLILLTDGFYEWSNAAGEQFGVQRISEIIRGYAAAPPATLIEKLYQAVLKFVGDTPQSDDLTAVIVKRRQP